MKNLLVEEKLLSESNRHWPKPDSGDHVFRFCTFEGVRDLQLQLGSSITACFLDCTFRDCEWYDPFFNETLAFRTRFVRCTFHGASFRGCWFVACEFEDCRFERNALGSPSTFDDQVRWYGCKKHRTPGLEGQF
ncbi:MAG: pentapeptide repeat-containing protein [Holophagales bacterium]|nr:pentapeptide repeat-containing protein [Holophagales bacterium]